MKGEKGKSNGESGKKARVDIKIVFFFRKRHVTHSIVLPTRKDSKTFTVLSHHLVLQKVLHGFF
jgi:hypothetical protein